MKWKIVVAILVLIIVALIFYVPADIKVTGFVGKSMDYNPMRPEEACQQYDVHIIITNTGLTPLRYDNVLAGWQSAYDNLPTHTVNLVKGFWRLGFMQSDTVHLSSNGYTNDLFLYRQEGNKTFVGDSLVYFYLVVENNGKYISKLNVAILPKLGRLLGSSPYFKNNKRLVRLKFKEQEIGSALKF